MNENRLAEIKQVNWSLKYAKSALADLVKLGKYSCLDIKITCRTSNNLPVCWQTCEESYIDFFTKELLPQLKLFREKNVSKLQKEFEDM
jgi:hypothetical protein